MRDWAVEQSGGVVRREKELGIRRDDSRIDGQ